MASYDDAFAPTQEPVEEIQFEPISDETLSLLMVGNLSKTFKVAGHTIIVRTLKMGEELAAGLLASKWKDSDDSGRAYAAACVAASVQSVDGRPLVGGGLGPNDDELERKFNYVLENWYWVNIMAVYEHYLELVKQSNESLDDVKKD